jgi:hypothetical protein
MSRQKRGTDASGILLGILLSLSLSEYWIMLGIEQDVFSGHVIWFNSDFLCAVGCVNIMSVHT